MDIRKSLRTALLKEGAHKDINGNSFGCVMAFLKVDKTKWDEILEIIDDDDLYEPKGESGYGKEKHNSVHVTILYGLHNDIPDEDIEKEINKIKTPTIKLGKVSSFENKFDVLKYDVISDDLGELNEKFKEFPHTNTFKTYTPHVTVAYLQPGKAKKYIDKLNKLDEIEVTPEKIVYSKADGTKKNYKLD